MNEAVRDRRGTAVDQVADCDTAMDIGGPMVTPMSSLVLRTEATL